MCSACHLASLHWEHCVCHWLHSPQRIMQAMGPQLWFHSLHSKSTSGEKNQAPGFLLRWRGTLRMIKGPQPCHHSVCQPASCQSMDPICWSPHQLLANCASSSALKPHICNTWGFCSFLLLASLSISPVVIRKWTNAGSYHGWCQSHWLQFLNVAWKGKAFWSVFCVVCLF